VTEGDLRSRVEQHLQFIYPALSRDRLVDDVLSTLGLDGTEAAAAGGPRWDEHDVAVITYADSITEAGKVPMQTMHELLDDLTGDVVSVVHVLPFYPASSDGGFAITDHRAVDPRLGAWEDITDLSETYTVMADLVVNHVSADHPWMEQFCSAEEPGSRYLLTAEPEDDLDRREREPPGRAGQRGQMSIQRRVLAARGGLPDEPIPYSSHFAIPQRQPVKFCLT